MLVKTEAVMNARVTTGTSKYHASKGSLAAPSMSRSLTQLGNDFRFPGLEEKEHRKVTGRHSGKLK